MTQTRLECGACGLAFEGCFGTPRLARLRPEDQSLVESFVLAGGNLKALSDELEVSYPTVRKRIDALIFRLQEIRAGDDRQNREWLREVESGNMKAESAARLMRETAHG
jgi:hypothetical protein